MKTLITLALIVGLVVAGRQVVKQPKPDIGNATPVSQGSLTVEARQPNAVMATPQAASLRPIQ